MTFDETIKTFSNEIKSKIKHIDSEETTKTSLILPFIDLMGYDFTNPEEVKAEYVADIGVKKGEKIDLAILINNEPEILIECKTANNPLNKENISQLYRYFSVTSAKIGVLTNGWEYQFYTDSEKKGNMDRNPFLEINLLDLSKKDIAELSKFTKENYDIESINNVSLILKYTTQVEKVLKNEIELPNDDFVRVIAKQVYPGVVTQKVIKMFRNIIRDVLKDIINDKVNKKLLEAIDAEDPATFTVVNEKPKITTSQEEIDGYYIIRSIASEIIDPEKITIRDRQSYCGILYDNNQNYPIARFHFNNLNNMTIGLFDNYQKDRSGSKKPKTIKISQIKDIYKYKENILQIIRKYEILKK